MSEQVNISQFIRTDGPVWFEQVQKKRLGNLMRFKSSIIACWPNMEYHQLPYSCRELVRHFLDNGSKDVMACTCWIEDPISMALWLVKLYCCGMKYKGHSYDQPLTKQDGPTFCHCGRLSLFAWCRRLAETWQKEGLENTPVVQKPRRRVDRSKFRYWRWAKLPNWPRREGLMPRRQQSTKLSGQNTKLAIAGSKSQEATRQTFSCERSTFLLLKPLWEWNIRYWVFRL